jgi:peptide/nickel transport system substrate-binding protein
MMLKKIAIVAGLGLALSAAAEAQTPRKGGTIRMTAPYWN